MSKLIRVETLEVASFVGYLDGAQHAFKNGELDIVLETALLEINDKSVTDEEVISHVYDSFNPIDFRKQTTSEEMVERVHQLLTIARGYWRPQFSLADHIERDLREGYWRHLEQCFDYRNARVVELGDNVPYVEMGAGFTFILYAPDMSRCLILVGNASD